MQVIFLYNGEVIDESTSMELASVKHSIRKDTKLMINKKFFYIKETHIDLPAQCITITITDKASNVVDIRTTRDK